MAQIVCVHGALRPDVDTPVDLTRSWFPALSEGLELVGQSSVNFTLQCAWYADLLREPSDSSWPSISAELRHAFDNLGGGATVRSWLNTLLASAAAQHISDWAVQLFLAQAWRYLNDPMPRAESRLRVQHSLTDDTRVVIAHSLGSVVAWETLMRTPKNVDTLITIGSPLAMPQVIANKLQPSPQDGLLARPAIRRWVNISHVDDWIAHPSSLDDHVAGRVEDNLIEHSEKPHDVLNYLRSAPLARAVAKALQLPPEKNT